MRGESDEAIETIERDGKKATEGEREKGRYKKREGGGRAAAAAQLLLQQWACAVVEGRELLPRGLLPRLPPQQRPTGPEVRGEVVGRVPGRAYEQGSGEDHEDKVGKEAKSWREEGCWAEWRKRPRIKSWGFKTSSVRKRKSKKRWRGRETEKWWRLYVLFCSVQIFLWCFVLNSSEDQSSLTVSVSVSTCFLQVCVRPSAAFRGCLRSLLWFCICLISFVDPNLRRVWNTFCLLCCVRGQTQHK